MPLLALVLAVVLALLPGVSPAQDGPLRRQPG
jgi:hypothetical protein